MPSDFQLIGRIDTDRSGDSIQRLIQSSDASSSTAAGGHPGFLQMDRPLSSQLLKLNDV